MQENDERWLPLPEAARELGVSVDTLRRRLKRNELRGERRSIPQGFIWWVCLDGLAPEAQVGSTPRQAMLAEVSELGKLVRELQAENRNMAGQIGFYQAKLQQAEARVLVLEAPKPAEDSQEAVETAENRQVVLETTPEHHEPWWRRVWQLISV